MGHPERALALNYANSGSREVLAALFALDATLARLSRRTREPIAAQLRLAWWRDALATVAETPVAGQPILAGLHRLASARGLDVAALAGVVDGWEALVLGDVAGYARGRGRRLFEIAGQAAGAGDRWLGDAGEGWAFADLARTSPDPAVAAAARGAATPLLAFALAQRASRAALPLGALALVARMDLDARPIGSPARIGRLLRYRLFRR